MNQDKAIKRLAEINHIYQAQKTPKYKELDFQKWKELHDEQIALKPFLKNNSDFKKLFNAVSQIISKLEKLNRIKPIKRAKKEDGDKPDILMNTSERGVNKSIPCVRNNNDFPFHWYDEKTGIKCTINNGVWNASNYMLMDILSYELLMKIGGGIFPGDLDPTFKSGGDIVNREAELKSTYDQKESFYNDKAMQVKIEMIKKSNCYITFDDKKFRTLTGKKMNSNSIRDLIHRSSNIEFRLVFPVRMFDEGTAKEKPYEINYFSRLCEFGYINKDVRKSDGVVRNRVYYVSFNTMLGELFVHNLKTKNYDFIPRDFYSLPDSAQIFYRKFILNHDFSTMQISLSKIKYWLNLTNNNLSSLNISVGINIFNPLKKCNLIIDFKQQKGPNGIKYHIIITN